ncbi:hypothetical protein BFW38_13475 [Terasakiispira papahanaumokuakeensis]|uniref:Zinc-ribbon 15 domain-containing protein n=1 Tax=Terasakiispira papahanaumokuakeensis TaxID=197479 RepID=A0A1E2VBP4_9GAMM|nr:hypothetical protein [Terasakiispira papahanaumokuakeensis]ODC04391.1 hypothetical protein BFW38_13475 [Terasakiispira papahanaumokuakeensis]
MIFFGSRSKTVTGQVVEGINCPNCENQQFITYGLIKYFHLYWIPTLITSKTVGIECTHCKKNMVNNELPEHLSKEIKTALFTKKQVLPMFSGLIIIACLVVFGVYTAQKNSANELTYIEQPAVHDLYIVNLTKIFDDTDPEYKYGIMRITHLKSGQAEFQVSRIAYNKRSGARKDIRTGKASSEAYYDDSGSLYIDIDKLKDMKEAGAINSIKRLE